MFKLVSTLELLFTTSIITIRALNLFLIGLFAFVASSHWGMQ